MDGTIDTFIDSLLGFLVKLCIPTTFVSAAITKIVIANKWIILGVSGLIIILSCSVFLSAITGSAPQNYSGIPECLQGYLEKGFENNSDPIFSPFGGKIGENTLVTAYFHDLSYYKYFGIWHEGIDLVPSINYYRTNEAYKLYGDVVIFATCSGIARSLRDSAGANYIYLTCNDGLYAVLMVHNKYNFIPLGKTATVIAGQPVAIMGSTGNATGPHVHYAIKDLRSGDYINPLGFINGIN